MKKRILSIAVAAVMAVGVAVSSCISICAQKADIVPVAGENGSPNMNVSESVNLIPDAISALTRDGAWGYVKTGRWYMGNQTLECKTEGSIEYLAASNITLSYDGFGYYPGIKLEPGTYKITCKLRTSVKGETSQLRVFLNNIGTAIDVNNTWKTYENVVVISDAGDALIKFCGGPNAKYIQNYDIAELSVVSLNDGSAMDYFSRGDMDTLACLDVWNSNGQTLTFVEKNGGGYLECSNLSLNYVGFTYTPPFTVPAGTYKFTGYLRMAYENELTHLRLCFNEINGSGPVINVYPTSSEWMKVETYLTLGSDLKNFKVCGGPFGEFVQSYCMDNFSLVKVDSIPEGVSPVTQFGTPVSPAQALASTTGSVPTVSKWDEATEAQYQVQGLVVNQDADGFITSCADGVTYEGVKSYALGFKGSHITDYMIAVNNTIASFPSETWTDVLDKYYQTEENGVAVDYKNESFAKGAYQLYEVAKIDYIDVWCEIFPTIGINPWLSFRMNDVHGHGSTASLLLSEYYHANPQLQRVQHGSNSNTYYDHAQDYTYELVRQHMLELINEALDRYDCYGIELDFQREIWLWHTGGEYNGIEILNDFMRKVAELVKTYETKYGHEIKIGVRCAANIQTNYDFGLDILTWAAEDIIDMVSPCGRFTTTDNDIPVKLWKSAMSPFGVEVWPGIECNITPAGGSITKGHSYDTYTAAAANYLSQDADKVYLFNYFRNYKNGLTEEDKVSSVNYEEASSLNLATGKGYWNLITTLGSHSKLMKVNRRMILTYSDTKQLWENSDSQLPKTVTANSVAIMRIPVGDVPEGAKLTLKFGVPGIDNYTSNPPTVYVNSKLCTYVGTEYCKGGYTSDQLMCYTIPAEAHNEMYVVAEIVANANMTVTYAEIYLETSQTAS